MSPVEDNAKVRSIRGPGEVEMYAQMFACITFDEEAAKGMKITTCLNPWIKKLPVEVIPSTSPEHGCCGTMAHYPGML
jgi:hypothetical protein